MLITTIGAVLIAAGIFFLVGVPAINDYHRAQSRLTNHD